MESTTESRVVGNAFVQQYYIQMHKDPSQLHRFYLDQSSFVHGGTEVGSEKAVAGQKAIHDKIMSLGLNQVHTRIKQVECLSTLAGGIVVQVTGDLSVGGKPSRAFVQTFVLAPTTPKVYYVHNSIFRYQDDDLVSESEADDQVHTSDHVGEEGGHDEYSPSGDSTPEDKAPAVTEYEHAAKETGDQGRPEQEETTTWESFGEVEGRDAVQNGQPGEEDEDTPPPQPQEYTLEPASSVLEEEEPTPVSYPPVEVREVESEQQQQQHKQPKTFASCLSKSAGAGTKQAPSVPTSSKPAPPTALPQRESKSRRPPPSDVSGRGPPPAAAPPASAAPSVPVAPPTTEPAKKPPSAPSAPVIPDSFQVFVGGLPGGATVQDLKTVFEKFGNVTEVRVNPKNFAFVIFDSEDAAKSVITCKEPFFLNTKRLNIEQKKERGGSSFSRGPRSFTSGGEGGGYARRQGPPMGSGGVRRGGGGDREPRDRSAPKSAATAGGGSGGSGKRFAPSH